MKDLMLFNELKDKLKSLSSDTDKIMELYGMNKKDAELEKSDYSNSRDRAAVNDVAARNYIIDSYVKLLTYLGYDSPAEMAKLIDFDDLLNNNDYVLFEILLATNDLTHYLDKYNIGVELAEDNDDTEILDSELEGQIPADYAEKFTSAKLRNIIQAENSNISKVFLNTTKRLEVLATMLYAKSYGSDVIDSLTLHLVSEVAFRDKNYIYVIYKGVKIWLEFLRFTHTFNLELIQKKGTGLSKDNFDEANPSVITAKANSSRVTVVGFSVVPDRESRYYNERIFTLKKMTLEDMLYRFHTINQAIFNFMVLNQRGRGAYLVSGADMGVGKSSILQAMLAKTPLKWGIGILDPQNEMQLSQKFPEMNVKTLVPGPYRTIEQCFEILLKQARDVLCVSEIAGPAEMGELVKASSRLNSGVGGTLHSISPDEVVSNCTELLMSTNRYDTRESAELAVAKSINLVFHMAKLRGGRIVVEAISEIVPMPRDIIAGQALIGEDFTWKQKLDRKLEMEQLYYAKMLYTKPYRMNPLFKFNRDINDWEIVGTPTQGYMDRVGIHLTNREMNKLRAVFEGVSA